MPRVIARPKLYSLSFDGTNSRKVSFGAATNARSQVFTLSGWAKLSNTNSGANRTLVGDSTANGIQVRVNASQQLNLVKESAANLSSSTGTVPMGQWFHWAVSFDTSLATTTRYYINGQPAGTSTATATFVLTALEIGNRGSSEVFCGNIARHVQFNQVLTDAQVAQLYATGDCGVTPSLLADFTEGSGGTTTESSANAYVGTITGATWSTDIPYQARTTATNRQSAVGFNSTLVFNGTTSRVNATSISGLGSGLTVITTVKPYDTTTVQGIFGNATGTSDQLLLRVGTDRFYGRFFNGTTSYNASSSIVTKGNWYTLAYTYDGASTAALYVNNVLQVGTTAATSASANSMTIGARNDNTILFSGQVGQTLVYNRVLTATELSNYYTSGIIPTTGLVRRYDLSEGAGSTAFDSSAGPVNGTITAGSYTADVPSKTRLLVGGNLVANPDFEFAPPGSTAMSSGAGNYLDGTVAGSATNSLFSWGSGTTSAGSWNIKFDNTQSVTGTTSIKASTLAGSSAASVQSAPILTAAGMAASGIPVLPNTQYTGTCWVKTNYTSGTASGAGGRVNFVTRTANGTFLSDNYIVSNINSTTGWTQYTGTFTTSASTRYVAIKLEVFSNPGTLIMDAWFDGVTLTPTTNTTRTLVT